MKILITAPNLDESQNVSGISTVVRQLIASGRNEYIHFRAGRSDLETSFVSWFVTQMTLPARFLFALYSVRPEIVHINTAFAKRSIIRDTVLSYLAGLAGKPIVLGIHGGEFLMNDHDNRMIENTAAKLVRQAKVVTVLTEQEKKRLSNSLPELNISILPNAVVAEDEPPARDNHPPVITYFGRMHEAKGLQEIVEASELLSNAGFKTNFNAYGEGPMREWFVEQMKGILGDSFDFRGVARGAMKRAALEQADIFLLPSRFEGLPLAMLEAMAAGCIVIASDIPTIRSVINDGSNGFLVKPGDGPGLASKLKLVLSDRLEWPAIRAEALNTVRKKYNIKDYIEKLDLIYQTARA